jgi:hypothetical protein
VREAIATAARLRVGANAPRLPPSKARLLELKRH